jgi:hypothetical protein
MATERPIEAPPMYFVIGYAVADGLSLATLGSDGMVSTGPVVQVDTGRGKPLRTVLAVDQP